MESQSVNMILTAVDSALRDIATCLAAMKSSNARSKNLGKNTNNSWNCRGLVSLFELHEAQQSYKICSNSDNFLGVKKRKWEVLASLVEAD